MAVYHSWWQDEQFFDPVVPTKYFIDLEKSNSIDLDKSNSTPFWNIIHLKVHENSPATFWPLQLHHGLVDCTCNNW